jgi:hypothetical protein
VEEAFQKRRGFEKWMFRLIEYNDRGEDRRSLKRSKADAGGR